MQSRMRRSVAGFLILTFLGVAGCVQKRVEGDLNVYAFEWWIRLGVIAGGLIAIPAGWILRTKSARLGYVLLIGGPLALIFLAPMMFVDEAKVDSRHFECRYGLWWSPTKHNIAFDDLQRIHLRVETKTGRRGKEYSYYFDCFKKAGGAEAVSLGDLMKEAAEDILIRAKAKNIPITGLEQLDSD